MGTREAELKKESRNARQLPLHGKKIKVFPKGWCDYCDTPLSVNNPRTACWACQRKSKMGKERAPIKTKRNVSLPNNHSSLEEGAGQRENEARLEEAARAFPGFNPEWSEEEKRKWFDGVTALMSGKVQ